MNPVKDGGVRHVYVSNRSLSVCFSLCVCVQKVIFPNQDDVLISFLPLAHMFERLIEVRFVFLWSLII